MTLDPSLIILGVIGGIYVWLIIDDIRKLWKNRRLK